MDMEDPFGAWPTILELSGLVHPERVLLFTEKIEVHLLMAFPTIFARY